MIIDLRRFVISKEADWKRLEALVERFESDNGKGWPIERIEKFNALYRKACSDLAQAQTFSSDPEIIEYLERLVARAYGQIYKRRTRLKWADMVRWAYVGFPRAFRKNASYFWIACAMTIAGAFLGGFLVTNDAQAKTTLFGNFGHLLGDPSERVENEESRGANGDLGSRATFSSELMTHNIRVSLFALSLGLIWGVGTVVILFYNGAILGAVCVDYIAAGEGTFLAAWLLPHGVIEIPAILLAGQVGLMLARALIGWDNGMPLGERMKAIRADVVCLIGGIALMLVWAGIVESYLSQTHEPQIAYSTKIAIGLIELLALVAFLAFAGRRGTSAESGQGDAAK